MLLGCLPAMVLLIPLGGCAAADKDRQGPISAGAPNLLLSRWLTP
jgi:hypothetical protein